MKVAYTRSADGEKQTDVMDRILSQEDARREADAANAAQAKMAKGAKGATASATPTTFYFVVPDDWQPGKS
jgi:hypothetical protein